MASPRLRKLLFTLGAAVGVPLLFFAVVELGLRVAGAGFEPGFFVERTIEGERVLTDNPHFGWRFFPPELARSPQPFSIPAVKPPGTVRVCVLGGSAAMGDPDPSAGMPRVLQAMLEAARPDLRIEVVNAAMTAINSHVVLPIGHDCLEHGADLLVVYVGNNEVVGPFGAGSVFGLPGAGWRVARANVALQSTRIGQLVGRAMRAIARGNAAPESWGGMELFLENRIRSDDPRLDGVYANLRRNVSDLCRAAERAGVPVVLSGVGVNLRSCAPFASAPPSGEHAAEWEGLLERGREREAAGDPAGALAAFREAAALDDEPAELRFLAGRCLLAVGDSAAAAPELAAARDLDLLRFRADSVLQRILAEVGEGRAEEGVHFVDAAAALDAESPGGIPGHELFDDHVHPTFRGNWVIAREIAGAVLPLLPPASGAAVPPGELPGPAECAERMGYGDWKRVEILRTMRARRERPPFAGTIDAAEWAARIEEELEERTPHAQPYWLRRALAGLDTTLARHPDDWYLQAERADLLSQLDDVSGAVVAREALARRFPHSADAWYHLGEILTRARRRADAVQAFERAARLSPEHFLARNRLGEELVEDGRVAEALPHFRAAIRANPRMALAWRNEGDALLRLGRPAEAVKALEQAVAANPDLASAHKKLGDALAELGENEKAAAAYRAALEIHPGYEAARERLERLARP